MNMCIFQFFFLPLVHCECATAAIAHNRCCRSNAESKFVTLVDDDGGDGNATTTPSLGSQCHMRRSRRATLRRPRFPMLSQSTMVRARSTRPPHCTK